MGFIEGKYERSDGKDIHEFTLKSTKSIIDYTEMAEYVFRFNSDF